MIINSLNGSSTIPHDNQSYSIFKNGSDELFKKYSYKFLTSSSDEEHFKL